MREEVRWRWRIRWGRRWTTTDYHATEEAILRVHPEAMRLEGTMQIAHVAETPEEVADRMYRENSSQR